jgi:uncharacterized protein (TIGR00290 family)
MKVVLSWSSGKDSAWTLHVLRSRQGIQPAALLTSVSEAFDRVSMHGVRTTVLRAQAAAAGLPLISVPLPTPCSNEIYEERMGAAVHTLVSEGFTHVAFGDLFLEDIRAYREDRLRGSGLEALFPLWGSDTRALAREMVDGGLDARITCLDPRHLSTSCAGRRFDHELLDELPAGVDPCGERGEFHTCVTAGPMFGDRVDVEIGEVVERDGFVFTDLQLPDGRRSGGQE